MSKAFTKDDGPETSSVLRRRAPLPEGTPNYVTLRGLHQLRAELSQLDAAPPGTESAEIRSARRAELELRLAGAVVTPKPENRGEIRFGAMVRIRDDQGHTRELQIVGVDESDASGGLVAFTAPLARALLGRRVGDVVSLRKPGGEEELTIVGIEYR